MAWEHAQTADAKLADFLATYTSDDALAVVEGVPGRGFEAWRKLKLRYNPSGGGLGSTG